MKRTIRFKRTSVQPKKKVSKGYIVLVIFLGLAAFVSGFFAVRPLFLILGIVS
ncbi:MAG: hypothetical protein IJP09_01665 [Clostridia bacterium]|nr:hypothetical protein [Clostridia bacterium]